MSEEIVHDMGSMQVIFTPNELDSEEGIISIHGMRTSKELPEEYLTGYPMCYKYDRGTYILIDYNGNYTFGDGMVAGKDGVIYAMNPRSVTKQAFGVIVDKLLACAMRLYEINHKSEKENMFKDSNMSVESIVYDFDGCKVTVGRVRNEDKFTIDINPGSWEFNGVGCTSFEKSNVRGYQWFMQYDNKCEHFNNGDKFSEEDINIILKCVKGGVESRKKLQTSIKLMAQEEMVDLVDNQKVLPAKVSLMQWERKLEKIKAEKLTSYSLGKSGECALCYEYRRCSKCSLKIIGNLCGASNSIWYEILEYDNGNHEEFVCIVNKMIEALKKAVEYEEKQQEEEVYYAGKMKIMLIPIKCNKYKIKIEGMKNEYDTPHDYQWGLPRCYIKDNNIMFIRRGAFDNIVYENSDNIIRTHEEAMEIVKCLKECSDRLHEMNGPSEEITQIGKMVLKAKKVRDNVYQCSIIGMKEYNNLPREYIENRSINNCCVFSNDNRFVILNKYYKNFVFSQYSGTYDAQYVPVDNFKVTKEELDELKKLLQICSDNLHKINSKYYKLEL